MARCPGPAISVPHGPRKSQTLRSEITRLAKKQVRVTCLPPARDVRRLKRTGSALRKTVAGLAQFGAEWQAERQAQGVCPYRQESDFLSVLTYVVV